MDQTCLSTSTLSSAQMFVRYLGIYGIYNSQVKGQLNPLIDLSHVAGRENAIESCETLRYTWLYRILHSPYILYCYFTVVHSLIRVDSAGVG